MKHFLLVFAVVSAVAIANGFATVEEAAIEMIDVDMLALEYTDEQIQCVRDKLQKILDENPELKWWFDELEKSLYKIVDGAKKCKELSGLPQKKCILKLKIQAQLEIVRLLQLLPADKKHVLSVVIDVIKGCLE